MLLLRTLLQEVMQDPVLCEDGHTYERAAVAAWLAAHHNTSSETLGKPSDLVPNLALRDMIIDSML